MISLNSHGSRRVSTQKDRRDEERVAANLRRGIELTELALALRLAMMRQDNPACTMADVMREIRVAKERAWRPSQT